MKLEDVQAREHRILTPHDVAVDLHPYCQPDLQPAGSTERDKKSIWAVRAPAYHPLYNKFSKHPDYVSLILDEKRRTVVLLFEPSFTDWQSIQSQIPLPRSVPVELRPACHTSKQRGAAQAIIEEHISDPALPGIYQLQPEPAINGFRVYVIPGHQKEAALLKEKLGSIVNIWFSPYFEIVTHGPKRPDAGAKSR